ncbi:MAG: DUF192 domain-containing protein [Candidatus Hydrogenedentota bacterium]
MTRIRLLGILGESDDQARGLMGLGSIPEDSGMLFSYVQPLYLTFWMKNTFIPLDLAFIGPDMRINEIVSLEPLSLERIESKCPSMMALEVNRGTLVRFGVTVGHLTKIDGENDELIFDSTP